MINPKVKKVKRSKGWGSTRLLPPRLILLHIRTRYHRLLHIEQEQRHTLPQLFDAFLTILFRLEGPPERAVIMHECEYWD